MSLPSGYPAGVRTIVGGLLLGFGAFVNQSCVFGSIAKLGSGYWSYVATPIGYYVGCLIASAATRGLYAHAQAYVAPSPLTSAWLAMLLLAGLSWVALRAAMREHTATPRSLRARLHHLATQRVWEPGAATAVIGITFLGMLLLVGAWTYTDALADFARGMRMNLLARCLLFAALFAGALIGGWNAGRLHAIAPTPRALLRCFSGGTLMGLGSWLIPGGNDGLILVGMPLLWPYAWLAFASMVAVIAASMLVQGACVRII
jgi:toxin CptA